MALRWTRRFVLIAGLAVVTACQGETTVQNEMLTDTETLNRFVALPARPVAARYSVIPVSDNDSQFFAEITFEPADFTALSERLRTGPPAGEPALVAVPDWFDPALLPVGATASDKRWLLPAADILDAEAFSGPPGARA